MYVSINLPMCTTNTMITGNGFYVCCVVPSGIAFFKNRLLYILIKHFLASQCVPSLPFFYEDIRTFLTEATAGTILKVFICQQQSQLVFFPPVLQIGNEWEISVTAVW